MRNAAPLMAPVSVFGAAVARAAKTRQAAKCFITRRRYAIGRGAVNYGWVLAERGRFELPEPVKVQQFSRLPQSTTLPPLRDTTILALRAWESGCGVSFS